jgi:tetratricopeptide (TPR) repeat protein
MNGSKLLLSLTIALIICGAPACAQRSMLGSEPATAEHRKEEATEQMLAHARAFARASDYARAEQYLLLAAQSGAEEERVAPLLISVCIKDQRYRAAIQHAEHHLRRHPRAYRLRFVQATLLAATGDIARARSELERVLQTAPGHADAHYAIAVLLRDDLGNHFQADAHFREYLRLAPQGAHAEEAAGSLLEQMP